MHLQKYFPLKRKQDASPKSIDPGQPAQSVLADLGRNVLLLVKLLDIKGPLLPNYLFGC